jgi:hypothetical protein
MRPFKCDFKGCKSRFTLHYNMLVHQRTVHDKTKDHLARGKAWPLPRPGEQSLSMASSQTIRTAEPASHTIQHIQYPF